MDHLAFDQFDLDFAAQEDNLGSTAFLGKEGYAYFSKEALAKISTIAELVGSLPEAPRKADDLIAEALQAMSLEDREKIVRELYGIEKVSANLSTASHVISEPVAIDEPDNDPHFLDTKLQEMDNHVKRMKSGYGWNLKLAALELAESQNLAFTQNRRFRLQFLRCDRFNTTSAADRFVRYFDWKLELFGEECLTREITINDLPKEDQVGLKKGYLQRLPIRDRAGRSIVCAIFNGQTYQSPESVARIYFYLLGCQDEETEKRGQVGLFFKVKDMNFKSNAGVGAFLRLLRFLDDFPVRQDATHKFMENEPGLMGKVVDFAFNFWNPETQARTRVHKGTYHDWNTTLMSFGIPHDVIPFTQSHKVKTKNHLDYLAMRARAEEILASPAGLTKDQLIDLPSRKDVLLGKGRPIQFSSGNQGLITIVDGYLDQYHTQSTKLEKTALATQIVRMLQASGVRFLSKEQGIWMEVPNDMARDKVSHMFRHQKKKVSTGNTATSRAAPEVTSSDAVPAQEQAKRVKV